MWKRLPRYNRGKENQIGKPVLIDTTYDATLLGRTRDISDMQIEHPSLSARPAFGRCNTEDVLQELPQLPFRSVTAPFDGHDTRYSTAPSASVYSQPSPTMPFGWAQPITEASTLVEEPHISPPSSPEPDIVEHNGPLYPERDVSPIDDSGSSRGGSKKDLGIQNHIPRPRRTDADVTTQWDDFSGYHAPIVLDEAAQPSLGSSAVTTAQKATISERASRFKERGLMVDTRPPWKGASGRSAIVGPLKDNPSLKGRTLAVPARNDRRPSPALSGHSGITTPSSAVQTARRLLIGAAASSNVPNKDSKDTDDEIIKPIVPLKAGRNSPPRDLTPTSARTKVQPYPSPITPSVQYQDSSTSKPYRVELPQSPEPEDLPAARRASIGTVDSSHTARQTEEREPVSRFSWTTYATETTYQQSPPSSPPPPMPTIFSSSVMSTPTPAPVISRRRPVRSIAASVISSTSRKPVPTSSPASYTAPKCTASSASPSDTSKALPQPPTLAESSDHVSSLQAQLDDLQLRRRNINRVVRDLSSNQATSPLVADLKQRKETEKRVKEYEAELMEIGSQEHEVGLKLHRAWKKKEREEGGGYDSVLWVRRVTG